MSPTLYAVLQELGTGLFPLLCEGNQGQGFIEGQLAQKASGGIDVLSNLWWQNTRRACNKVLEVMVYIQHQPRFDYDVNTFLHSDGIVL